MNKYGGLLLIAVLALTGCATTPQPDAESKSQAVEKEAPAEAEATEAPPVLVAEEPANDVEAQFYTATKRIPGLENVAFEDALEVGEYVCAQLDSGVSPLDITAVQNTEPQNNRDMISVAALTLCTEHEPVMQKAFIESPLVP